MSASELVDSLVSCRIWRRVTIRRVDMGDVVMKIHQVRARPSPARRSDLAARSVQAVRGVHPHEAQRSRLVRRASERDLLAPVVSAPSRLVWDKRTSRRSAPGSASVRLASHRFA